MNRANQHALFQATNQGLLNIRQAELQYYINLNSAFGTQAALIGGFTYGIFTQNQQNTAVSYSRVFMDLYWICASGTIAAAVHVILTTMLMQVLGPGLALHGPIGSMARACDGLRREQKTVITSFIVMIVLFSISTIFVFWSVFTFEAALSATIVWIIAIRYCYIYCQRIYLRFFWKDGPDYWQSQEMEGDDDPLGDDTDNNRNPMHETEKGEVSKEKNNRKFLAVRFLGNMRSALMSRKSARRSVNNPAEGTSRHPHNATVTNPGTEVEFSTGKLQPKSLYDIPQHHQPISMEGFLMIMRVASGTSSFGSSRLSTQIKWERRYCVLFCTGHIFYYKNRVKYREKPLKPLRKRPLTLRDFYILVFNSEQSAGTIRNDESERPSSMIKSQTSEQILFYFTLSPKEDAELDGDSEDEDSDAESRSEKQKENNTNLRNSVGRQDWVFRCDTGEELNVWIDIMRQLSPTSFRN